MDPIMERMPMWYAVDGGGRALIEVMLSHGLDINAKSPWGNTCLHVAACLGSDDVVHTLLENGADPNIGDDNGCTALHSAACDDDIDLCKLLISYGADKTAETKDGLTPCQLGENTSCGVALHVICP
ncbi:hypothetical protein WJX82_003474 [Trebouxia sp. C0006]